MQYGPSGGAVRVVIASDAPQAVAELDKLAGYADQVCLVGFIRHPDELDEDLEALRPDLVLLYTSFGGLDTVSLAANLASRSARLRVMVVVDPADEPLITRLEDVGAATVPADASPLALVTAIRGAAATSPPAPALSAPPAASWPGMDILSVPPPAVTEPPPEVPAGQRPGWAGQPQPAVASGTGAGTEPAPAATAAQVTDGPDQPPAVHPTGVTAWPERPPGAVPTGTTTRTEPAPAEVAFPSSVPVFQLDTAAFEPPPTGGPASGPEWPGVPVAKAVAPPASEPEQEPIQPLRPRPARRRTHGHAELTVIFSGKGGVGKSLIATNLAVALAAEGEKAAIVDLDLQFGDVAVMLHAESHPTGIDALEWARHVEELGAGEILLTSMDADGTQAGFDCELTATIARALHIPVIASGGAGSPEHIAEVFQRGCADAALAASIFHYETHTIRSLKEYLRTQGVPVRI